MTRRLFAGFALFTLLLAFAAVGHTGYKPEPKRFTDNGDGTVTQNATGLIWQKTNDNNVRTWQAAMDYCNNNSAGLPGSGWRLPAVEELKSIIGDDVFSARQSFYWSASSYDYVPNSAWTVDFYDGSVGDYNKGSRFFGRCVR